MIFPPTATMDLVIATKNRKKLQEIRALLRGMKVRLIPLSAYPKAPRVVENGVTFQDNAIKKAVALARFSGRLSLGEDSGLCVDALGGRPGVYSSRFAGRHKSDLQNNLKVLRLLNGVPVKKRTAHYVCAVAVADAHGLVGVVGGRCHGVIGLEPKGSHGFGYDPLFLIPRYGKTFGQLGERIKHTMSHRYHALKKVKPLLRKCIEGGRGR